MSDDAFEALIQEIGRIVHCPYPTQLKVLPREQCCSGLDADSRVGIARPAIPAMHNRPHMSMGGIEAMSDCEGCPVRLSRVAEMAIRS